MLVLTACHVGGGGRKEAGQSTGGDTGGSSAGAFDINAVARDNVPQGGTLRWLFTFDPQSRPTPNRNFLESGDLTSRAPLQVVTYKLNPKAVWSDGTPITEADFEAQWKANNGTDPAYRNSSSSGYEQIESVTKGADEREVVVTFKQP